MALSDTNIGELDAAFQSAIAKFNFNEVVLFCALKGWTIAGAEETPDKTDLIVLFTRLFSQAKFNVVTELHKSASATSFRLRVSVHTFTDKSASVLLTFEPFTSYTCVGLTID